MTLVDSPTSQPLHELIYLNLRSSILVGEIGPSDRVVESRLAAQMQVSRTPVREAIRRLQQEGLLTTDPVNGITPVEISLSDAIHLYDCRIALEALAVEGACRHATPDQIEQLRHILVEADTIQANAVQQAVPRAKSSQDGGDAALRQRDLNYAFHHLIAESSQNPWIVSLLDQLASQVKLLRLQILQTPVDVDAIQAEHWTIVAAIAQHDAAAAAEHIRHHLEVSKIRIAKALGRQAQQEKAAKAAAVAGTACPRCGSQQLRKNGRRKARQNYLCKACGRQFLAGG